MAAHALEILAVVEGGRVDMKMERVGVDAHGTPLDHRARRQGRL